MSLAKSVITGIVLSALMIPPIPIVSAIVCLSPYFFGISKSVIVQDHNHPPEWHLQQSGISQCRFSLINSEITLDRSPAVIYILVDCIQDDLNFPTVSQVDIIQCDITVSQSFGAHTITKNISGKYGASKLPINVIFINPSSVISLIYDE